MGVSIERVEGTPEEAESLIRDLVAAYFDWAGAEQVARGRLGAAELPAVLRLVEANVRAELPAMLSARGRLLVAKIGAEVVGLGAIKPVDQITAEVKRMFIDPAHRGRGIARALIGDLIAAARAGGYRRLRLETADFMTSAHGLYRAVGFRDVPMFDGGEAVGIGLQSGMHFMELRLDVQG